MPYIESHGTEIYYEAQGTGPAAVFAHGMGGNGMIWWQQVPYFAERHRTIVFDHRGFARSPCPADEFDPAFFADDVLAILDADGIDRAALVCQSMGGWTGLGMSLQAPERVRCLALCATPGGLSSPKIARAMSQIGGDLVRERAVRGNLALAPDFPKREPAMAFLYDQISAMNPGVPPEALARLAGARERMAPDALADYAIPTLMITGENDQLFPRAALHEVAEQIPGIEIRDLARVGHSSYFEDPRTFNALIESFIDAHL